MDGARETTYKRSFSSLCSVICILPPTSCDPTGNRRNDKELKFNERNFISIIYVICLHCTNFGQSSQEMQIARHDGRTCHYGSIVVTYFWIQLPRCRTKNIFIHLCTDTDTIWYIDIWIWDRWDHIGVSVLNRKLIYAWWAIDPLFVVWKCFSRRTITAIAQFTEIGSIDKQRCFHECSKSILNNFNRIMRNLFLLSVAWNAIRNVNRK